MGVIGMGIWVPERQPEKQDRASLVLTGRGGIGDPPDDGYYQGRLRISRDGVEIRLRITHAEFEKLCKMGIEEWC